MGPLGLSQYQNYISTYRDFHSIFIIEICVSVRESVKYESTM